MKIADYQNRCHLAEIRKKTSYLKVKMNFILVLYFKNGQATRFLNPSDEQLDTIKMHTEEIISWDTIPF